MMHIKDMVKRNPQHIQGDMIQHSIPQNHTDAQPQKCRTIKLLPTTGRLKDKDVRRAVRAVIAKRNHRDES